MGAPRRVPNLPGRANRDRGTRSELDEVVFQVLTKVMSAPDLPATIRAFYALAPNEAVRARLAALGRDVARRSRGRAVAPENAHLTLAFLGDVATTALPVLQAIGNRLPPIGFVLEFDSLGAWRASGVAWVAPSALPPALPALPAQLAPALLDAGFVHETRPFRAHVTLARRCLQPAPRARCAPIVWPVDRLLLIGSELRSEGPIYRELGAWPLRTAA